MKKPGCGPMAAIVIIFFALLVLVSNEGVGYFFSHCNGEDDIFACLMDELEEPAEEGEVVATGVYTYKDYEVTVTANIPLAGGEVSGSFSGTCEGRVKGTYNGQPGGVISGTMNGACSPFFINIPASADYSGTVNKTGKTVPISFNGKGGGITHEGSLTLTYP